MLTRRLGLLLAAAALSLLGGCASTAVHESSADAVDSYKVAAIERAAAHNGVRVYWIHYPLKKSTDKPTS
jgi:hypothetical protein